MDLQTKIALFRERFYGRQDVYGRQWLAQKEDGSQIRGYAPVCENLWKDFCHLRIKDGVQCIKCEHRRWAPVTSESVERHISGEEAHIYYVLQTDTTIKFGAMDFDMKPGKEEKGYGFQEVKGVSNLLREYEVPHYIARSTGAGYHLYVFFEDFCPAYKFRSFVLEIFERVGFMQYLRQGLKPIPEYFPKQSYAGRDGIGNGIKPPMIDPQIEKGRNCWVDDEDKPITDQWSYFSRMRTITHEEFDRILEERQIPLDESEIAASSGAASEARNHLARDYSGKKWQHPITGSIEKVLTGCRHLRRLRDKALKGDMLGHNEGFAIYHMCMHTQDGLAWFKEHVKGWGDNDKDMRQLDHSVDKNYLPWTCKKLQENAICAPGTQCFEKRPPREMVDGMEVLRDDIPKDKWPEPSPIRYAYGRGEDYLEKLMGEVTTLKNEKDPEVKAAALKGIAKRIQVFDEAQQKEFKAFVREQKPIKRNDLAKIFNEASDNYEVETKEQIKSRDDSIVYDDNYYMKAEGLGYIFVKTVRDGKKKFVKLCSVDIIVQEERVYQDDTVIIDGKVVPKAVYAGIARAPGIERKFELPIHTWLDTNSFTAYFGSLLGRYFSPLRANIEYIKQAVLGFSEKIGVERTVYLSTQGYQGETYLTPTCIVDATGVRPNTTQRVELEGKETRNLDFSILSDTDHTDTLIQIKTVFLTTWPELWTYTGLAHTFMAGMVGPLDWHKRTTLFYEGLTGSGKSELTQSLQYFWGKFPSLANFFSSAKGIRELAYQFKDACLVVDDYKGLSREQVSAVKDTIQRTYDESSDFKCLISMGLATPKASRCIFIMSGEEFISNDAAVVARTILIETGKQNTKETEVKLLSVQKYRPNYKGVTPRFLSWFLSQDRAAFYEGILRYKSRLKEGYYNAQNIDRIAQNLAFNYATWVAFTQYMVDNNAASGSEKDTMDIKHWAHVIYLRNRMVERCSSEQSSEVFLRLLNQLIVTGEVTIANLPGMIPERKITVGFVAKDLPYTVCLFPKIVCETVKNYSRSAPILGTELAIGRQLEDQNALSCKDPNHLTKNMRFQGKQVRVWCVKMEALGLDNAAPTETSRDDHKIIEFKSTKKEDFGIM